MYNLRPLGASRDPLRSNLLLKTQTTCETASDYQSCPLEEAHGRQALKRSRPLSRGDAAQVPWRSADDLDPRQPLPARQTTLDAADPRDAAAAAAP
jgi:hypothetical protein